MKVLWRFMGGVVLLAATTRAAAAAPVVFTNEAEFNAALAAAGLVTSTESFEGVEAGIHGVLDFGAFKLEPSFLTSVTDEHGATDGKNAIEVLVPEFLPTFFFDRPIRAFSMDVGDVLNGEAGDFIFSVDDRPDVLFSGQFPDDHLQFVGILDLVIPFTELRFFSSEFTDVFTIDRVRFEDENAPPVPVPEPASLTLVGLGLVGAGTRLRRHRRQRILSAQTRRA